MNMVVCSFNMGNLKFHHSLRTGISESENGGSGHVWVLSACLEASVVGHPFRGNLVYIKILAKTILFLVRMYGSFGASVFLP
jgi:hypothetical protein